MNKFALDLFSCLVVSGILAALTKIFDWISRSNKRSRRKFLTEIESPDFYQKKQRSLFRYVGLAIYSLGCYIVLTTLLPSRLIMFRLMFGVLAGLAVLCSGGMVMADASVMNEYGTNQYRRKIEQNVRRTRERQELDSF